MQNSINNIKAAIVEVHQAQCWPEVAGVLRRQQLYVPIVSQLNHSGSCVVASDRYVFDRQHNVADFGSLQAVIVRDLFEQLDRVKAQIKVATVAADDEFAL